MTLILTGSTIPDGQLCLTFDDGPGPHTADVSSYLRSEGISATFFLIGAYAAANSGAVQQLIDDGHEVGNHTHTHPALTQISSPQVGAEIARAHEELRPFVKHREGPLFFRPPFGWWPTISDLNEVRTKGGERLGDLYAGPISWDFDRSDWWHWQEAKTADDPDALRNAVAQYSKARRGIVLMHDHCQIAQIAGRSQTHRMIKQLVPEWKAQGCSFISLRDAYHAGYLDVRM